MNPENIMLKWNESKTREVLSCISYEVFQVVTWIKIGSKYIKIVGTEEEGGIGSYLCNNYFVLDKGVLLKMVIIIGSSEYN